MSKKEKPNAVAKAAIGLITLPLTLATYALFLVFGLFLALVFLFMVVIIVGLPLFLLSLIL